MPFPFIPALISLVTPLASKLLTAYVEPKLLPVVEKVGEIETKFKNLGNDKKHDKLLSFIDATPAIRKFIDKCGWNAYEIDVVIKFCVLISKKPPTKLESRERWNNNDGEVVFDFARIIITKWIQAFSKKRGR